MSAGEIALISALFGGAGLKMLEAWVLPKTKQADIATTIREELRADITGYRQEVKGLRSELDEWKRKYFRLLEVLIDHNIDLPADLEGK